MDGHPWQTLTAVQEAELDEDAGSDHGRSEAANERERSGGRSPRGQHIVDDQDAIVFGERVVMNFQDATAIFERVFVPPGLER